MDETKGFKYDALEIARTVGEPVDPRKPFPTIVSEVCTVDFADPDEFLYHFDVLEDTEKVLNISASGEITQENVTPDTPVLLSFTDLATPEYYVKVIDLASAKERVLARKVATINRALNSHEEYLVISLLNTAASNTGNEITLRSGYVRFIFPDLVDMIDQVQDYGDGFLLIEGTQIAKDIRLWDWDDNKFHSPQEALRELGVRQVRMPTTMNYEYASDGSAGGLTAQDVLASTTAYLVATSAENGKPGLFVRKRISEMEVLGGAFNTQSGERPQRLVFVSPNPVTVVSGSTRFLAVGLTGYEQITTAISNQNAVSEFTRV